MKITEFTLMRVRVRGRPLGRPVVRTVRESRTLVPYRYSRNSRCRTNPERTRHCVKAVIHNLTTHLRYV